MVFSNRFTNLKPIASKSCLRPATSMAFDCTSCVTNNSAAKRSVSLFAALRTEIHFWSEESPEVNSLIVSLEPRNSKKPSLQLHVCTFAFVTKPPLGYEAAIKRIQTESAWPQQNNKQYKDQTENFTLRSILILLINDSLPSIFCLARRSSLTTENLEKANLFLARSAQV